MAPLWGVGRFFTAESANDAEFQMERGKALKICLA